MYLQAIRGEGGRPSPYTLRTAHQDVSCRGSLGFAGKLQVPVSELLEDCYALSRVFLAGWGHKGATS